jgi:uncharacterized membrane protein YtjA (UPF0391 family)
MTMSFSWTDLIALIAILSALVGFTFTGPGTAQQVAQAVFYAFTVIFFLILAKRIWHRPKKT